jgi:transketolase
VAGRVALAVADLSFLPQDAFDRVRAAGGEPDAVLALLADMCRLNTLVAVKRAGSGHLGSSFSALDIVAQLLFEELNPAQVGFENADRDVFFSSKGHDVPGLYAVLHALGVIPAERLLRLRRLGGLDGHPDVGVPGIEANSGSLGMGLSKGRGIAWAKRRLGLGGRVVVMTGDGELQEGQNWEALQAAAHDGLGGLWAIVDRNELQSDKPTAEILALGDLEAKLFAFGWHVARCDGHDHSELRRVFRQFRAGPPDRPKVLVAETIKGKGVSFMEHPRALEEGGGTYRWHAGAPDDDPYGAAREELLARVQGGAAGLGVELPHLVDPAPLEEAVSVSLQGEPESGAGSPAPRLKESAEFVAAAFGEALEELAATNERLVVLDADLASDCRVRGFELAHPDRFLEVGIAEQDMVSAAAGMARHGLVPVVNSFASFLASRANEQIYNQASEGTKVVYALHYAGLIPAGPGKSHQSVRDVSLLAALPGMTVVQPGNAAETRAVVRWAVEHASGNVAIRLAIGPSPRRLELPGVDVVPGRGHVLTEGDAALLISYGPVLLHETLLAGELLRGRGVAAAVVAMPWLNQIDTEWLAGVVAPHAHVLVVEDHAPVGALGDALRRALALGGLDQGRTVEVAGVDGWPACGTPPEALQAHGLDAGSLAMRVEAMVGAPAAR